MEKLNIFELLQSMLTTIADYAPSILGALVVLLLGFLFAKFSTRLLRKLLNKLGADRISDYINNMQLFGENSFTISLSRILSSFFYYMILLMVWVAAADVLGIPAISKLLNDIIHYIPNLLIAFVYLLIRHFCSGSGQKICTHDIAIAWNSFGKFDIGLYLLFPHHQYSTWCIDTGQDQH